MKYTLPIFIFLITFSAMTYAQDSTNVAVETPEIVVRLAKGRIADFGDIQLRFLEVVTDSRCPRNTQCVWAGEAIVNVELWKNGESLGTKQIKVFGGAETPMIYTSEDMTLMARSLDPYPVAGEFDTEMKEKQEYSLLIRATGVQ